MCRTEVQVVSGWGCGIGQGQRHWGRGYSWAAVGPMPGEPLHPRPESGSPPPAQVAEGERLARQAGVFTTLQVPGTQREVSHPLYVVSGTHVIRQEFEVHIGEIIWLPGYWQWRDPAVGDIIWLLSPHSLGPRGVGPQPPPPSEPGVLDALAGVALACIIWVDDVPAPKVALVQCCMVEGSGWGGQWTWSGPISFLNMCVLGGLLMCQPSLRDNDPWQGDTGKAWWGPWRKS